jgi:hypothetical protein
MLMQGSLEKRGRGGSPVALPQGRYKLAPYLHAWERQEVRKRMLDEEITQGDPDLRGKGRRGEMTLNT